MREMEKRELPANMYFSRGSLEDLEEINEIEHICFPPNEACAREHFIKRLTMAPDHFLLLRERGEDGKDTIVGFVNDIATDRETITDEIAAWMEAHGVETLDEIRGCARNAG